MKKIDILFQFLLVCGAAKVKPTSVLLHHRHMLALCSSCADRQGASLHGQVRFGTFAPELVRVLVTFCALNIEFQRSLPLSAATFWFRAAGGASRNSLSRRFIQR